MSDVDASPVATDAHGETVGGPAQELGRGRRA